MCANLAHIQIFTAFQMVKPALLKACRHLLGPVVQMLLRSGVTWADFAEISKQVFVDVARRDFGLQGRPTNVARVAMMTGLSRREVSRVRDALTDAAVDHEPAPARDRISYVLTAWHLDPDFATPAGAPRALPLNGGNPSLETLFKRYAGDLPHGAMLKELVQLGLVAAQPDGHYRALAREYVRSALDPDIVRQMGVALHDHAATLAHNVDAERKKPARFEGMASNPNVASRYARAFQEFIEQRGTAFLEEVDAWLSAHELNEERTSHTSAMRMGAGLYLIHDELARGRKS
jgi:hypothetical protein